MKKLLCALASVALASCTTHTNQAVSNSPNFIDGAFRNTSGVEAFSLWEIMKTSSNSDIERAEWPEEIQTDADTAPLPRVESDNARITFVNHATFLLQVDGLNILTDPVFSERISPVSFAGPKRAHKPGIDIADLPKIDIMLISHDHYDHLDLASAKQLIKRDNPQVYVGLGLKKLLGGTDKITEMDWWQRTQFSSSVELWFLDVQHNSGRSVWGRNTTLWGGFLLKIAGKNIYFGGDSGYAGHYKRTHEHFGNIDLAFLPIGAYSPREVFQIVHMDPFEAVQAHKDLQATLSIGMHYGTFQLTAESRNEPVELLEKAKYEAGIGEGEFITLDVGVPVDLPGFARAQP